MVNRVRQYLELAYALRYRLPRLLSAKAAPGHDAEHSNSRPCWRAAIATCPALETPVMEILQALNGG